MSDKTQTIIVGIIGSLICFAWLAYVGWSYHKCHGTLVRGVFGLECLDAIKSN